MGVGRGVRERVRMGVGGGPWMGVGMVVGHVRQAGCGSVWGCGPGWGMQGRGRRSGVMGIV